MITVVFQFDLSRLRSGECKTEESNAFQAILGSIENAGVRSSSIQLGVEVIAVLALPKNERTLGDLIYWCNHGNLPYKTLWLNDIAEWRDGGK